MKRIVIITPHLSSLLETFIYSLNYSNTYEITLVTHTITEGLDQGPDHKNSFPRLKKLNGIKVLSFNDNPFPSDLVLVNFARKEKGNIDKWVSIGDKFGLIVRPKNSRKHKIKELIDLNFYLLKADCIISEVGIKIEYPYSFFKRKFYNRPHLHPQFLLDSRFTTHPIVGGDAKNYRFSFVGSRTPLQREITLEKILQYFKTSSILVTNELTRKKDRDLVLWSAYGANDAVRGFYALDYLASLSETLFSICPRGWGRWTHRLIESIYFGAIPLLEDPEIYDLGLNHLENCIVVKNGNWLEAIDVANNLSDRTIADIQGNLLLVRNNHLIMNKVAERLKDFIDSVII